MPKLVPVNAPALSIALLCLCASGCSVSAAVTGDACERSTQCSAGLACVQGKCSTDLQAIAKHDTIPNLGLGRDVATDADGGSTDASSTVVAPADAATANVGTRDAATRAWGQLSLDAAAPPPVHDAATQDAAISGSDAG
jgi:hypothetical protein